MPGDATHPGIATSSVEEGLDFACNLLVPALEAVASSGSGRAEDSLRVLANYLQLRYVGELGLAFELLSDLAGSLAPYIQRPEQMNDQLAWLLNSLQLESPNNKLQRTRGGSSGEQ